MHPSFSRVCLCSHFSAARYCLELFLYHSCVCCFLPRTVFTLEGFNRLFITCSCSVLFFSSLEMQDGTRSCRCGFFVIILYVRYLMSVFVHCLKFAVRRSTSYLVFHLLRPVSIIQPWGESGASAPSLAILLRLRLATLDANLGILVFTATVCPLLATLFIDTPLAAQNAIPGPAHIAADRFGDCGWRRQWGGGREVVGWGYKHSNLAKRFIITTTASSHRSRHIDGSMIGSVSSVGGLRGERNVERVSGKGRMF